MVDIPTGLITAKTEGNSKYISTSNDKSSKINGRSISEKPGNSSSGIVKIRSFSIMAWN